MMAMPQRIETDLAGRHVFELLTADDLTPDRFAPTPSADLKHASPPSPHIPRFRLRKPPPTPAPVESPRAISAADWSWLPDSARTSPTGLARLYVAPADAANVDTAVASRAVPRLAIAPPFPIRRRVPTTDRAALLEAINPPLHVGIVLIRYGYVAIGIAFDETLQVTKTDTRWVPNQHRAGGQSANRFKRSREKWAREFFDKASRLTIERLRAYPHRIDYLIFGGDRQVIRQFQQRTAFPDNLSGRILTRRLNPSRPNRAALDEAVRQAWSSTLYELGNPAP